MIRCVFACALALTNSTDVGVRYFTDDLSVCPKEKTFLLFLSQRAERPVPVKCGLISSRKMIAEDACNRNSCGDYK